jgi:hypothetical protein
MPLAQQTVSADGRTTVIEPINTRQLRDTVAIARGAAELAWSAIGDALGIEEDLCGALDPEKATEENLDELILMALHNINRIRARRGLQPYPTEVDGNGKPISPPTGS